MLHVPPGEAAHFVLGAASRVNAQPGDRISCPVPGSSSAN